MRTVQIFGFRARRPDMVKKKVSSVAPAGRLLFGFRKTVQWFRPFVHAFLSGCARARVAEISRLHCAAHLLLVNFALIAGCGGGGGGTAGGSAGAPPAGVGTVVVTPSVGANGSISPATAQTISRGATAAFTIFPAAGYTADVGGTCGGTLAGITYTTNAVSVDCTVVATFNPISTSGGATYFVAVDGNDANTCAVSQSNTSPRRSIQAALACLAAGDSLVLRDGTYGGAANAITGLPNGNTTNAITLRAENEGNVILTAGIELAHSNSHLIFQGLRFQDTGGRQILGNHLKFFRNEFKGGCASGNCAATTVGSNDVSDTADILFEDNWFHGRGGRYNLLVFNANRVVVRRAVIRHDAGWTDTKGDPEAGLNFYNSSNCSAQNVLIIDNDLAYTSWQGAFYSVYSSDSPGATANNSWIGSIALKNPNGGGIRFDGNGAITGATVEDMVLWDTEFASAMGSGSSTINVAMNRITAGNTAQRGQTAGFVQFARSYAGTVNNAIIANSSADAIGVPLAFFDTFNSGNTSAGIGRVTYSPFANGLVYLTRIEAGGALKTAGSGGGQIGAQIVNRIGAVGTLQGESGWNTDTGAALWPFPNESRIRKEMCADAGVTRGFCADISLTRYIMNYLGNGNPY